MVFLVFISIPACAFTFADVPKYIKICSFNIAELGNPNKAKDNKAIAEMLLEFDLIKYLTVDQYSLR